MSTLVQVVDGDTRVILIGPGGEIALAAATRAEEEADRAEAAADEAEASEVAAALYATGALVVSNLYPDTTAGLAASAEGEYFGVVGSGETFASLYREVAGVAVNQNLAFPSVAALLRNPVQPEDHGAVGDGTTDDTAALQAALDAAEGVSGTVFLSNATYIVTSELLVPVGVNITGTREAVLKLADQITTTTTGAITSGTGAKTFTVASSTGFLGRSVMIFTGAAVSPDDAFSHAGRQVSAAPVGSLTIAAGPNVQAHAIGATVATTSHLLRCLGNNIISGFTIDGNAANNTYAHWINSTLIAQEGDNCVFTNLHIKDTPSDAILPGGPSGGEIVGVWVINNVFENVGGNGVHAGNCSQIFIFGNKAIDGNMRWADPVNEGGGNSNGSGHQDGFGIFSDNCSGLQAVGNSVRNYLFGFGAFGSSSGNVNDDILITGNEFYDCYRPLQAQQGTRRLVFTGNRCIATYPYNDGVISRWDSQAIYLGGAIADDRIQDIVIANNYVKNGTIYADTVRNGTITGNLVDNRELNANAAVLANFAYGIALYNFEALNVSNNVVIGGYVSLWLQNAYDIATHPHMATDSTIANNLLLHPNLRGVSGTLGSGATMPVIFRGNRIAGRLAATKEDDSTALTFNVAGNWKGVTILNGMQVEDNRIDFDITLGGAWDEVHAVTSKARHRNKVNGVYELQPNYANDAAAAIGNVPVGAWYRNGSILMQRVA